MKIHSTQSPSKKVPASSFWFSFFCFSAAWGFSFSKAGGAGRKRRRT